jgi:hypothetical protein
MKKIWWAAILIILIIVNIIIYKINLDQEERLKAVKEDRLTEAEENLDRVSNFYIYGLVGAVIIIVLMISFALIQRRFL